MRQESKKRVFIIHGFDANPKKHWFMWLKDKLESLNISANILSMPNPQNPILEEWIECISKNVGIADRDTFFVAHSLGTITTLQYIQTLKNHSSKIGGILLVSGFCAPLPSLPELDSFARGDLDVTNIIMRVKNRIVIAARDDEIVPCELSENLAQKIEATFVLEPKGGHFMQSDGFSEFPLLFSLLQSKLESI